MSKPTFKESYDKIVQAYYKDEIKPWDAQFCFCGTLCNNTDDWMDIGGYYASHGYSGEELKRMEAALLEYIPLKPNNHYEKLLFKGMCAAVEELKKIHIERGENIDEQFLTKRKLHEQ